MGYRPDNPAGDVLGQALGRQQAVVQHMQALPQPTARPPRDTGAGNVPREMRR